MNKTLKVNVHFPRLADMGLLTGQTGELTMTQLRKNPGDVIEQVRQGKTFTISKAGKVIAVLSKPEPTAFELGAACRALAPKG